MTVTSFGQAFLSGAPQARGFLPDFRDPATRRAAVAAAARPVRPELIAALRAQQTPSAARDRHLAALAEPGTVAVVTGQQPGLFLGPLYTVYKALTAVVVARALATESGRPVVPVFWLQSEDHDLAEIDHVQVPGPDGPVAIRATALDPPPRASVAHVRLGAPVALALASLEAHLGGLPHAAEHLALLRRHWRPEATYPGAMAGAIGELFAGDGLLVLDPRAPAIARLAAPVHRRALLEAESLEAALRSQTRSLASAGFAEQVHVRPGAALSFVHEGTEDGPRWRLERRGDGWAAAGGSLVASTDALLALLDVEPRRFSTSALLRPILQDTLLPTAAYVGGPGEIAYLAQVAALWPAFGLPVPLIVPRGRFRLLGAKTREQVARLGLTPADLARPFDELVSNTARPGTDRPTATALEAELRATVANAFAAFDAAAAGLDPGLLKAGRKAADDAADAVTKLAARYGRALGQADTEATARLTRVRDWLAPGGAPQERVYGLAAFAARWGGAAIVAAIRDAVIPYDTDVRDVELP